MVNKVPLIVGFEGKILSRATAQHLKKINPIGVIFFKRNLGTIQEIRLLIQQIKELLGEVILSIDHEGGLVNRFAPLFPVPPAPYALHLSDLATQKQGATMLAQLVAYLGFTLNFAPVLDLHFRDGFLGSRAFSCSPEKVTSWGDLVVKAHERYQVASCAKHFPGHGRVVLDTHQSAASLDSSLAELERLDLSPYQTTKAPMVMASHVTYPALDPRFPASLSKPILTGILKEKLQYPGLVVTDCLEMKALEVYSPAEMVRLGANAGLDLWVSSFSLKRSLSFQTSLAEALRHQPTNPQKLAQFIQTYQPKPQGLVGVEQAISLRKQVICQEGPTPPGPWGLLFLGGGPPLKINQGEPEHRFILEMKAHCPKIQLSLQLSLEQLDPEPEWAERYFPPHLSLLIAGDHKNIMPRGGLLLEKLAKGRKILHLDLGESMNLTAPLGPKWRCFGLDPLTIKAICSLLNQK